MRRVAEVEIRCAVCQERFILSTDSGIMNSIQAFWMFIDEAKEHIKDCAKKKTEEIECQKSE